MSFSYYVTPTIGSRVRYGPFPSMDAAKTWATESLKETDYWSASEGVEIIDPASYSPPRPTLEESLNTILATFDGLTVREIAKEIRSSDVKVDLAYSAISCPIGKYVASRLQVAGFEDVQVSVAMKTTARVNGNTVVATVAHPISVTDFVAVFDTITPLIRGRVAD